jgi:hypothetical protein
MSAYFIISRSQIIWLAALYKPTLQVAALFTRRDDIAGSR